MGSLVEADFLELYSVPWTVARVLSGLSEPSPEVVETWGSTASAIEGGIEPTEAQIYRRKVWDSIRESGIPIELFIMLANDTLIAMAHQTDSIPDRITNGSWLVLSSIIFKASQIGEEKAQIPELDWDNYPVWY